MSPRYTDSEPSAAHQPTVPADRIGLGWMLAAAAVTVVLWQVPGGNYVLYPFTILATWFHEMAHGLMALLLGGQFVRLDIFPNGNGVAYFTTPRWSASVGRVLIAAAGPMGPPLAGAALILASRSLRASSLFLTFLGGFLLLSTAIWVRSLFGIVAVPILGLAVLAVAFKGSQQVQGIAVQFLGVQACVSTYRQINYLFTYSAGPAGLSDTGQIQQILLLPYWFWGALMAIASLVILLLSLLIRFRR